MKFIIGNGQNEMDFTYVGNVAQAHLDVRVLGLTPPEEHSSVTLRTDEAIGHNSRAVQQQCSWRPLIERGFACLSGASHAVHPLHRAGSAICSHAPSCTSLSLSCQLPPKRLG
jgi:hypothetical protein